MNSSRLRNPRSRFACWTLLSVALWLPVPAASTDVDIDRLWLPKSHLRHLPRLYDAARLVKDSPRCAEFIEGTSQLDRSTLEHPIFKLTCRAPEGETYSLLVDGPSLHKLDETRPEGYVSFEQLREEYEQEQARLRERERKERELAELELESLEAERIRQQWLDWWEVEHERRAGLWGECAELLDERVGRMQALDWLTDTMPEPDLAEEPSLESHPPLTFVVDFNAQSYYGEELHYRAFCREVSGELELEVRPRRGQ